MSFLLPRLPAWLASLALSVSSVNLSVSPGASLPLLSLSDPLGTLGLSAPCSDLLSGGSSPFQIGLVVILVSAVVAMSAVTQLWEDEWEVLLISLQVSWGAAAASPNPQNKAVSFCHSHLSRPRPRGNKGGCYSEESLDTQFPLRQSCLPLG